MSSVLYVTEDKLKEANISLNELLLLILTSKNFNLQSTLLKLVEKGLLGVNNNKIFKPTEKGFNYIGHFLDVEVPLVDCINEEFLTKLKEIYPKGRKPGTNYYWTEGIKLIEKRLKLFFRKYGSDYTEEDILNATERYVNSFNGDYRYMKLLKYFIFKEENKAEMIESTSDLYTYLLEKDTDNPIGTYKDDWIAELQ